jgi:5'(3')-deoxyribonucleotidase
MKKTLYIDMDNVLVDFSSGMDACDPALLKQYEGHPDEIPGIFGLMQPMPGAVEAFRELSEIFDTYIASTAPWDNVQAWTEKRIWVEAYLGEPAQKRLILTHHKNLLRGDFIVDDRTRRGVDRFEGEHVHLGLSGFRTGKPFWNTFGHKPNGGRT